MQKLIHQKDLNGCGIACLSNLLKKDYDIIKVNFSITANYINIIKKKPINFQTLLIQ